MNTQHLNNTDTDCILNISKFLHVSLLLFTCAMDLDIHWISQVFQKIWNKIPVLWSSYHWHNIQSSQTLSWWLTACLTNVWTAQIITNFKISPVLCRSQYCQLHNLSSFCETIRFVWLANPIFYWILTWLLDKHSQVFMKQSACEALLLVDIKERRHTNNRKIKLPQANISDDNETLMD